MQNNTEENNMFFIGDNVRKVVGDYHPTGTIVASFVTLDGNRRYVMEFDVVPGMLHIFSGKQLELCYAP